MPRPCKKRRICAKPSCIQFGPQDGGQQGGIVTMTLEEYECIRLMDYEGLTQEQSARQMDAARTTIQGIYSSARRKIAQCLVNGYTLHLEGGILSSVRRQKNAAAGTAAATIKRRKERVWT